MYGERWSVKFYEAMLERNTFCGMLCARTGHMFDSHRNVAYSAIEEIAPTDALRELVGVRYSMPRDVAQICYYSVDHL